MERLIGFAIALQTLELLRVSAELREDGVFAWSILRRDYARLPRPLCALLDAALAHPRVLGLLWSQLLASLALLAGLGSAYAAGGLVVTGLALSGRFRGPYNGGSDAMSMVVLLGLLIARALGGERARQVGLGYVAAQLVLSYLIAGLVKLRQPDWREGRALAALLRAPAYAAPSALVSWLERRALTRAASWAVIVFECAVPLALLSPRACLALMVAGACFHLVNARVLGLNRFLWAWLSAYPALWYWATR